MTCVLNELATVEFTVGALVGQVDCYVLIDTGSDDGTVELIRDLYPAAIRSGRLIIEPIGRLPDYDMSIARNRALELLRAAHVEYFIKVDGDTVFYDDGARRLIEATRILPPRITNMGCGTYELYQFEADDTEAWLGALRDRRDIFWEMSFRPVAGLVHAIDGARAVGKWGDEQAGLPPEGIVYCRRQVHRVHPGIVAAHYGWARPTRWKRAKLATWRTPPGADLRLDQLHLSEDWRRPTTRFRRHPEVIGQRVDQVIEWLQGRRSGTVED